MISEQRQRMEGAARMVRETKCTKAAACSACGVKYPSAFSRFLRSNHPDLMSWSSAEPTTLQCLTDSVQAKGGSELERTARRLSTKLKLELSAMEQRREQILAELNRCELVLGAGENK